MNEMPFARGLKSNYFKDGNWDSSVFSDIIYFAVDSHQIFLNGVAYGMDIDSEKELNKRYNASRIRLNDNCNVGGVLSESEVVGEAIALIDDSLTWQKYKGVDENNHRVRFAIVDKPRGEDGTIEFCPQTRSIHLNGEIYGCNTEMLTEAKETAVTRSDIKNILEKVGEILDCDDIQRKKLRNLIDML